MAKKPTLLGQLTLGVSAVAAIVVAASQMKPVYVAQAPAVQRLVTATTSWRDSAAARAPWALKDGDSATTTTQYEQDRVAFAKDLVGTGRIDSTRADSIATYAVREAYKKHLPPALVFGALLTENPTSKSKAQC